MKRLVIISLLILCAGSIQADPPQASTFSIVACDTATGEVGVAVASRFFGVGVVVPWARADVGAIATQAYANTSFGWTGLELLESGLTPEEVRNVLIRTDDRPSRRQFGIVDVSGRSASYTGDGCLDWAGGRSGFGYAIQGNILAGEAVVVEMEKAWLNSEGSLADRLYAALLAGEAAGGDARGKQSAALVVARQGAGYGGYTDQAIDVRVDDHPEPFKELGRLLDIAQVNYTWNIAWTAFTENRFDDALEPMERTARLAPDNGEVWYDLSVIRLATGDIDGSYDALEKALELNPNLVDAAVVDDDFMMIKEEARFLDLTEKMRMETAPQAD